MSFVQIVTLVVFVLAGALMGFKAWRSDGPIPQPVASPEVEYEGPDPAVVPPVVAK